MLAETPAAPVACLLVQCDRENAGVAAWRRSMTDLGHKVLELSFARNRRSAIRTMLTSHMHFKPPRAPLLVAESAAITEEQRIYRAARRQRLQLSCRRPRSRKRSSSAPRNSSMPAIALADRNGLYGVARFHTMAKKSRRQGAYRRGDRGQLLRQPLTPPAWLPHQFPARAAAPAAALRIANRLSKSLPAHHALQDARGHQGRGRGYARRS